MSNITKEMLKRKEIRKIFGFIELKNPNPEQRKELDKIAQEQANEIIKNFMVAARENKKIKLEDFIEKFVEKNDDIILKIFKMLTNIPEELINEEMLEDPSDEVIECADEISNIWTPIFQKAFQTQLDLYSTISNDEIKDLDKVFEFPKQEKDEKQKKIEELEKQLKELKGE